MERRAFFSVMKALLLAYLVTGVLLFVLALALWKLGLKENTIELGVVFICLLSCASGGFLLGKHMEQRRLLWGIVLGLCYMLVLVVVSLIANGGSAGVVHGGLTRFLLCLGGGMLGAFLS